MGFRFTAERLARRYPVTGYVKNLPNGKAEIVAEGEEKSLQDFLAAVREAFHSYIRDTQISWSDAGGDFNQFGIKF